MIKIQKDIDQRFGINPKQVFYQRLIEINEKIEKVCAESGRDVESVRLLPITKTVPAYILRHAFDLGLNHFGENKVQEAQSKINDLKDLSINWSIVGHLQSNKVKYVSQFAREFHALDTIRLAKIMNEQLEKRQRSLDVYIQVNTSLEESKYGIPPENLISFLDSITEYKNLNLRGLMTLAIFSRDKCKVRSCFRKLRSLRDSIIGKYPSITELSMGMSNDFEDAIREGSNVIRIGQGIFGNRPTPDGYYWPDSI